MYAQLRYLDGPVEGQNRVASRDFITIGRHPDSDVPFDPERDLQVSIRHAAIFKQGGGFMIRDLGSSNGTFLNGKRVRGDLPLEPHDVLQLGPTGPRLEFSIVDSLPRLGDGDRIDAPPEPPRFRRSRARTTERLAIPVLRRRSKKWRWVLAFGLVGVAALATRLAHTRQDAATLERERGMLLGRADDLLTQLEQTRSTIAGLDAALATGRREATAIRAALATGPALELSLDSLGRELTSMATRHEALVRAAAVDPGAWSLPVSRALVAVTAEGQTGTLRSGTGFAVATRGDSVWIVTSRELVVDSMGMPARRTALALHGATEVLLGRLARVSDTTGLALLAVRIRGGAPLLSELGLGAAVGDPVVVAGFPRGLDSESAWRATGILALPIVATVAELHPDRLALALYGQTASAGAPMLGPHGQVVGMLTRTAPPNGVPVAVIRAFLATLPGAGAPQ